MSSPTALNAPPTSEGTSETPMLQLRQPSILPPSVAFDRIDIDDLNRCLMAWDHKMGPLHRPDIGLVLAHGLMHRGSLVGVVATADLVRAHTVQGLGRSEAVELARVCAARRDLCRVLVRMWREFILPDLRRPWGISYQDAVIHGGDLYRFDGWVRLGTSRSGTDQRSGRKGRSKIVWGWHADPAERAARAAVVN